MCETDHLHSHGHGELSRRQMFGMLGAAGVGAGAGGLLGDAPLAAAAGATLDPNTQPMYASGYEPPANLAKDSAAKNTALAWIDRNQSGIYALNDDIWEYAELSLQEWSSSWREAEFLRKNGFTVEWGSAGLPTAFVATYSHGSGKPVIGFSGEYDALPQLSQQKGVPHHDPKVYNYDPYSPTYGVGHGCGHCALGTAAAAAAVATAKSLAKHGVDGTVKFFGSTAEEQLMGKAYAVKEGVYEGLDAFVDWHPGPSTSTGWGSSNAIQAISFNFLGIAGHGGTPLGNKSALDAATLMAVMTEFLREENLAPSGRLHYAIRNGGDAPNVTPEIAEIWYFIREGSPARVRVLTEKVINCAKAAALASQTTLQMRYTGGCWNKLPSQFGAELMHDNMQQIGAPEYSTREQEFGKALQRNTGLAEKGYQTGVGDLKPPDLTFLGGGSTDVADISWQVPTIQMGTAMTPSGMKNHTWAMSACSASDAGHTSLFAAAKYLVGTAVDLFTQPGHVANMKEEFEKRTKGITWSSLLPDGFEPPLYQPPKWFLQRTKQGWPPKGVTWPPKRIVSKEKFSPLGPELPPQNLPPLS